jgi:hypothetical protein
MKTGATPTSRFQQRDRLVVRSGKRVPHGERNVLLDAFAAVTSGRRTPAGTARAPRFPIYGDGAKRSDMPFTWFVTSENFAFVLSP